MVDTTVEKFKQIDCVINNAAFCKSKSIFISCTGTYMTVTPAVKFLELVFRINFLSSILA